MERWQFIRWGIAASLLAHLLIAGGIVVSTVVRPYELPKADEVPVDIVDADESQKTPEPPPPSPSPTPDLTLPQPAATPSLAAAAPPPAAPPPQDAKEAAKETAKETPKPPVPPEAQQQPSPVPSSKAETKPPAKSQSKAADAKSATKPVPAPSPSYVPAEPDLTVKYGVMLGLPAPLAPLPPADDGSGDDAGPTATTNLADDLVAVFRRHLKSCARLPATVSPADNVMVKLRVAMTPDGRLAAEPLLIAGTASVKALQLKQSAMEALAACQPYAMLPSSRYREWKVLELSFSPQDFGG